MRYARPVDHSELKDGSDIRMIDVFDTANYEPRPEWGQTDEDLLSKIFSEQKADWLKAGTWFIPVPDYVEPCAFRTGADEYENPADRNERVDQEAAAAVAEAALIEAAAEDIGSALK